MISLKRVWLQIINAIGIRTSYTAMDVFGCPECPPQNCPTFIERDVHRRFQNAVKNNNIIVVFGESRQGKTWTIEKYCPEQLRIGCTASKTVLQLKRDMLDVLGIKIRTVQHSITEELKEGSAAATSIGLEMVGTVGVDTSSTISRSETLKTEYQTVDLENDTEFLSTVASKAQGKYYVFDNFHYLPPLVQKDFCSLLKEFNYHGIKIIIVGVWKEASRITAMAPDLVNRCEHVDIGSWTEEELDQVISRGERALNIVLDDKSKQIFKRCCANNIGIFKTFLLKLVQAYGIDKTVYSKQFLNNPEITATVMKAAIAEVYAPLQDRIKNLALPQRNKKDSKHMRLKIVIAILSLIQEMDIEQIQRGILNQSIQAKMDLICDQNKEPRIPNSNMIQELGVLHEREENRQAGANFIPLFYYDKANRKLLIIEPTLYEIKEYDPNLITEIIISIKDAEKEHAMR